MKIKFYVFFICSSFLSLFNAQEIKNKTELDTANSILDDYVKKDLVDEDSDHEPYEYKKARKLFHYDIDDDGDKDLIAFYTLEGFGGGNIWQHYIAIFLMKNGKIKAVDNMVLFGDSSKRYNDGKLIDFKNGSAYYRLHGTDFETNEAIIKIIGITMKGNAIVTSE